VIAFLERGDKSTRVEAFVDAAFAFALTLLVIAGDRIPASVEELLQALKSLPAYALGFLLILKFWTEHVAWSRRYGLDDAPTRRLSLLLVFLVLVFVYPMKMVFGVLFSALTAGWLPANFVVAGLHEVPVLFMVFGVAFGSLGTVMFLLYAHAWRKRDEIGLSARERIDTRIKLWGWLLFPAVALLSIASALLIPAEPGVGWWLGFPGFIYFSLNIATPMLEAWSQRLQARMPADGAA
jgi:uncharacterized membrane protein